jgi:hypothetical protein
MTASISIGETAELANLTLIMSEEKAAAKKSRLGLSLVKGNVKGMLPLTTVLLFVCLIIPLGSQQVHTIGGLKIVCLIPLLGSPQVQTVGVGSA